MQSGSVETSAVQAVASPPLALMFATVRASDPSSILCSPSFMVRAAHTTLAPSEANSSEIICPMPRLAPVTIATLPVSLPITRFLRLDPGHCPARRCGVQDTIVDARGMALPLPERLVISATHGYSSICCKCELRGLGVIPPARTAYVTPVDDGNQAMVLH